MGTHFFKSPTIAPGGSNLFARAISAPGYAARGFSGAANKDLGAASALSKGVLKPIKKGSAYAPGPKRL